MLKKLTEMNNSFAIDRQTQEDLNLLGKYKTNSVFNLYNQTITRGGEILLEQMFKNPLINPKEINDRKEIFEFFAKNSLKFPFTKEDIKMTESYLENSDAGNILISFLSNGQRYLKKLIANDKEYDTLFAGFRCSLNMIKNLYKYVEMLSGLSAPEHYGRQIGEIIELLNNKKLLWILRMNEPDQISFRNFALCDHSMRYSLSEQLRVIMEFVSNLDLYVAVSDTGVKKGFVYAEAMDGSELEIDIEGIYHPYVKDAVPNNLKINKLNNVLFLTGANMAGKSTLMKSLGISLYLAHMGFPVAASSMSFNVCDGIYTSINVPDNLNLGYSHFYAEVMRVKKIALEVASGKRLLVIFDELFKGTNVKDAYDATVTLTESFAEIERCAFVVSTHIMEAGVYLSERCKNIRFKYLPSKLKGKVPVYPYTLEEGISDDRHGMTIINNEKIIETIYGC